MDYAPIVLFAYNRPDLTAKTLTALKNNKYARYSDLFVFCDGSKNSEDLKKCLEVRKLFSTTHGFKTQTLSISKVNLGLGTSIVNGLNEVFKTHTKAIILEDDLITSPFFLEFMNLSLNFYHHNTRVMHISGYSDPISINFPPIYFSQVVSTWGWGTWRESWNKMILDPHYLLNRLRQSNSIKAFDLDSFGYFINQLTNNISGKLNTWGIKWQATIFLNNGLCLNPSKTLVKNQGFGKTATNTTFANKIFTAQEISKMKPSYDFPSDPQIASSILPALKKYYRSRCYGHTPLGIYLVIKNYFKYHFSNNSNA